MNIFFLNYYATLVQNRRANCVFVKFRSIFHIFPLSAVVEGVLQPPIYLDHLIEVADDLPLSFRRLLDVRIRGVHRFDVKSTPIWDLRFQVLV